MTQIFPPIANVISKVSIVGCLGCLAAAAWVAWALWNSPYVTQADVVVDQPVPFSHKHHVSELGIDCRFCHNMVEQSSFAGMPTTQTCMTCHSQIYATSPMLEPVRASFRDGKPLKWRRVHDLPDFVYFDHSIHVNRGISCQRCHGPVDQMPLMRQRHALQMQWCLDCHRAPELFIGPRDRVFDFQHPPPESPADGAAPVNEFAVQHGDGKLTNCSICHR